LNICINKNSTRQRNFESVSTKRLFPCAEVAGYAGGIKSAAMDGERCAEKLAELYASYSVNV
jgi:uncharacterized FAD-dependent dehydrogenase